jgi:uncharacterized membrane protein
MGVSARDAALTSFNPDAEAPATPTRTERIASLDILRGIVMVLMAIDHVRVYAGVPAGGPEIGVFFTRWVTHFSAPVFAFLAGTAAYFHAQKLGSTKALSAYLIKRGAVLVLLELTYLRLAWTFNVNVTEYNLAGVIWMLGWCMIMLALLVRLPIRVLHTVGIVIVAGQAIFGPISGALPSSLGSILYQGGEARLGPLPLSVLYVLVPWIGVMVLGYAFGAVMARPAEERRRLCLRIGLIATVMFIAVATAMALGQSGEDGPPLLFRILNQRKYPASVPFLLMTLGPAIAFIPFAEEMRGRFARVMTTFGRVPFFFYLLHIPLIHALAIAVSAIREGGVNPWLFGNHPYAPPDVPPGYRWSLALLYLVFAIAIAMLYPLCRWYERRKATNAAPWMSYI